MSFSHTVIIDGPRGVKGTSFLPREGVPCSFRMGTDAYGGPKAEGVGHPFDRAFIAHVEVGPSLSVCILGVLSHFVFVRRIACVGTVTIDARTIYDISGACIS